MPTFEPFNSQDVVAYSPLYLLHITFKIDNQNLLSDQIKNFFQINLSIFITRFLDNVWIIIIGRSYMFITSGSWKVDSFKRVTISIKLIAKTVLWSYFVIGTGHHTSLIVNLQHWTLTIFWACVFISRNFSMHSFLTSKIFDNLVYKKKISLWNKYSQTLTSLNAHIHHSKCQGLVSIRISLNHEKHTTRMRNLIGKPPRVPP